MAQYPSSRGTSTSFRIYRMAGGNDVGDPVVLSQEPSALWSCSVRDLRPLWTRGGVHRREGRPGVRGRGRFRLDPLAESGEERCRLSYTGVGCCMSGIGR